MAPSLEREVRRLISRYVVGLVGLRDFSLALATTTWDVDARAGKPASDLAYAAELLVAEYTSGHRAESELKLELSALVSDLVDVPQPLDWETRSTSVTSEHRETPRPMARPSRPAQATARNDVRSLAACA
jgi:hypothetical protein